MSAGDPSMLPTPRCLAEWLVPGWTPASAGPGRHLCGLTVGHDGDHRCTTIRSTGLYRGHECGFSWPRTDAPPASSPRPEHVHTCTDPGPFIAQIAERDAEIARLREAGQRLVPFANHTHDCASTTPPFNSCSCGYLGRVIQWQLAFDGSAPLAGAAPKTETR